MKRRRKKKTMKGTTVFIFLLTFTITIMSIILLFQKPVHPSELHTERKDHSGRLVAISGKMMKEKVTLGAIGDILIHDTVYEDAFRDKKYDFSPMFSQVRNRLLEPDLLLANQETILGGVEIGLSSYPTFNSPVEVADALTGAGVDIVSNANNHSLDKSEKGILKSIQHLEEAHLPYVGAFKDPKDKNTLRVLNQNGIKVAYLSYTFGTNGIPVPVGKDYLVNIIDRKLMKNEIHRAKKVADVVVMSLHWGNEYQRFPTKEQQNLAQFLVDEGVDIIFGHHPHVLQPMEWMMAENGRKALVVFSLGNFLSGQMWDYKDIGGLATVEVTKEITSMGTKIHLDHPDFYPTFVSSAQQQNYRVVPLQEAGKYGLANAQSKYSEIMNHMTQHIKK